MSLSGKNILLGVTGGIAAYKAPALVRLFIGEKAKVKVCLTESATEFVAPKSLQAVSGHPVLIDKFSANDDSAMDHIHLARWADAIVIAPATANSIARFAHGMADNLLSCICLASESDKYLAPAMNRIMWQQPQVQYNLNLLKRYGWISLPVANGEQACGEQGAGRMIDPEQIISLIAERLSQQCINLTSKLKYQLVNKSVLISAGPTKEAIDPVRYLTNHSSGKMGYALAQAAQQSGAQVTLVSGPVSLEEPLGVQLQKVETAEQMHQAVMQHSQTSDIFIACAAVADYRPKWQSRKKMKKDDTKLTLELEKTTDIVADFARTKKSYQYIIGFAAETDNLIDNARHKLNAKQLDMIVANKVGIQNSGFNSDSNQAVILTKTDQVHLDKMDKKKLAQVIITKVAEQLSEQDITNPITELP